MQPQIRTQKGAYLIVVSVLLVVLIGFGALAVDMGRVFNLRSEMQNAADAAALAAAFELSRTAGSQARAEAAARNVLQFDSNFATVRDLLGVNIAAPIYYCSIGSQYDPDAAAVGNFCSGSQDADGRYLAATDIDSHYVRVTLAPADDSDAYSISLFLLPILNLFVDDVDSQVFLTATAVAGRNYLFCDYPPLVICNPFEPTDFRTVLLPGEQIQVAAQGVSNWAPGVAAFVAFGGAEGADALAPYLADEGDVGCQAPTLTTEPGQMTQLTENAIDTRFDLYSNPGFANAWANFPPAANVIDYPRDVTFRAPPAQRFGLGDWNRAQYWLDYHAWRPYGGVPPAGQPPGYSSMSRYEMYQWEIDNSRLPSKNPILASPGTTDTKYDGIPTPSHVYTGPYPPAASDAARRTINVAVVNCTAQGLAGRDTFTLFGREGLISLFITEQSIGPPTRQIWVEYIDDVDDQTSNDNIRVDIQLYE